MASHMRHFLFANVRSSAVPVHKLKARAKVYGKERRKRALSHHTAGKRWRGGESARMSLKGGNSPSTLAVPVRGRDSRLTAKERAAAKERSAD